MKAYLNQMKWIVEDLIAAVKRALRKNTHRGVALAVSLSLLGTQILPAGLAAETMAELRKEALGGNTAVTPITNVHVPESLPADQIPSGVWVPDGPISKVDQNQDLQVTPNFDIPRIPKLPIQKPPVRIGPFELPAIREMRKQIIDNLVDQFGLSREEIQRWIRQGLLKIDYDVKNNKATVTFDSSLKIQNPYDPLSSDPVTSMTYDFGYPRVIHTTLDGIEPLGFKIPKSILKITIKAGDKTYKVFPSFDNAWLPLPDPRGLHRGHVEVSDQDGKGLYSMDVYEKDGTRTFEIRYPQPQEGGVSSRTIVSKRMEYGKYHVDTVQDFDQTGQLLVTSKFEYEFGETMRYPRGAVFVGLSKITRTDKDGNVISEITITGNHAASLKVGAGNPETILYKDLSDLLKQAAEKEKDQKTLEREQQQAMQNAVVSQLQNIFGFTAEQIRAWIKQGLLKFAFDAKTLKVTLTIDPSVKLPNGHVNPLDPLGTGVLPREMEFQLQRLDQDVGWINLPGQDSPRRYSQSFMWASQVKFMLGDRKYEVDLNWPFRIQLAIYISNPLPEPYASIRSIKIFDKDGQLYSTTTYRSGHGAVIADVVYAKAVNGVAAREVRIRNLSGKGFVISAIADKNGSGEILGTTHFQWSHDFKGVYTLNGIRRTDGKGNQTSQISDIRDGTANVLIPGSKDPDNVRFANFEELLNLVRQMENDRLSPESQVGEIFKTIIGRDASAEELKFFQSELKAGKTIDEIKKSLEAAKKAIDDLSKELNLSAEQKAQIQIVSAEEGSWGGCWEGCKALLRAEHVVLQLFQNQFEYRANLLRPDQKAAIAAIKALMPKGYLLSQIKIEPSGVVHELANVVLNGDPFTVHLSTIDQVTWIYEVARGVAVLKEDHRSHSTTWYDPDGSSATVIYTTDGRKTPLTLIYLNAAGQRLEVDLTKAEITGPLVGVPGTLDPKALAAALKDLLTRADAGLPADGKLVLKNYQENPAMCTMRVGNNSCVGSMLINFESDSTAYHFEISESYRTDARDAKIPTSSQYTIKQFSKEPVWQSGVEIEVSVVDPNTNLEIRRKFTADLTQDGGAVGKMGCW